MHLVNFTRRFDKYSMKIYRKFKDVKWKHLFVAIIIILSFAKSRDKGAQYKAEARANIIHSRLYLTIIFFFH